MRGGDPGILLQFSHMVQHGVCLLFSTNIYHTLPKIATEIFGFFLVYCGTDPEPLQALLELEDVIE